MSDHAQAGGLLRPEVDDFAAAARRLLDIVLALSALIFLAPIMVLAMVAIVAESGRPLFFSQTRLGEGGRHFRLHKFRKFLPRDGKGGPAVTLRGDPRMTRVGRVLERTKLDELPQLWNVLKGDMSVVGPRPESLAFLECFGTEYRGLLDHKPGLLGPSQVLFRNEGCLYQDGCDPEAFYRTVLFPLKARVDLSYFRNRTFMSDLRWMVQGAVAVCGWSPLSCASLRSAADVEARIGRALGSAALSVPAAGHGAGSGELCAAGPSPANWSPAPGCNGRNERWDIAV